jgi:hypothetical protein
MSITHHQLKRKSDHAPNVEREQSAAECRHPSGSHNLLNPAGTVAMVMVMVMVMVTSVIG